MTEGEVIHDTGPAPIRAVLEAHGAGLALFGRRDKNEIVRKAMVDGGETWCVVFLPKRFTPYAEQWLGYSISPAWSIRKEKLTQTADLPFVFLGTMRSRACTDAAVSATATASKVQMRIKVPFGHGVRPKIAAWFKSIPGHEIKRVAEQVEKSLLAGIEGRLAARMEARASAPPPISAPTAFLPTRASASSSRAG